MTLKSLTLLILCILILLVFALIDLEYSLSYVDNTPRTIGIYLWEDGSFQVGQITGCVPFALCRID